MRDGETEINAKRWRRKRQMKERGEVERKTQRQEEKITSHGPMDTTKTLCIRL